MTSTKNGQFPAPLPPPLSAYFPSFSYPYIISIHIWTEPPSPSLCGRHMLPITVQKRMIPVYKLFFFSFIKNKRMASLRNINTEKIIRKDYSEQ